MSFRKTHNPYSSGLRQPRRSFALWGSFLLGVLGPMVGLAIGILLIMEYRQGVVLEHEVEKLLLIGVSGIALGTLAAACMARRISRPVRRLAEEMVGELAVLTAHCNRMAGKLLDHRTALKRTNRQLDQKALELSIMANYNESILASMTSGLFTLNVDGRFETFNAAAETLTGWRHTEVWGQPYHDVFAENMQLVEFLKASRAQLEPVTVPRLEFCRRDGQYILLSLRTSMLQDHRNRTVGLLVIFEDLSLLDMLERQLHRADRLASLGHMTAGIAHEIKNPLASIRTFAQLVRRKHHDGGFLDKFDRVVLRELDRIQHIIDELLELTKPTQLHLSPVSIATILQWVLDVHAEQMQQRQIAAKMRLAPTLPTILADNELLYRCFANIVLNAIEAMPAGGELTVSCQPVSKLPADLEAPDWGNPLDISRPDTPACVMYASDIEVVINDTGKGISEDQLEMLFTPFHTTKSKGTGLGLALAQKIIEEHRGYIHITSTVDRGTSVTVMLPSLPLGATPPGTHS
jgi:two-component system nitrogen regulation sensor histidine kinase GlnL